MPSLWQRQTLKPRPQARANESNLILAAYKKVLM
jgi:hypothetical protein